MAPGGCACMRRPRVATSRSPSASVITPASTAATNSPTLWPSSISGFTPRASQSCARQYSITKVAGWAMAVFARDSALPSKTSRRRSMPVLASTAAHSSKCRRNEASSRYKAAPMPGYCAPWPGNRKMTSGARSAARRRMKRALPRAAVASATSLATTNPRYRNALRPTRRVYAASASEVSGFAFK